MVKFKKAVNGRCYRKVGKSTYVLETEYKRNQKKAKKLKKGKR